MLSRNLFFCILIILHYPNEYCAYHTNYVRVVLFTDLPRKVLGTQLTNVLSEVELPQFRANGEPYPCARA